jgi:hypothetical protein
VIVDFGGRVVFGYDGGPAGAAGLRFSGFLWSWGRSGQAGGGIAAILAKTATMALAQGHVCGMRR